MGAEGPLVGSPVFKTDGDGAPVLVCSIRTRPRQLRTALSARGSAGAGGSSLPTATHCAAVGGCARLTPGQPFAVLPHYGCHVPLVGGCGVPLAGTVLGSRLGAALRAAI